MPSLKSDKLFTILGIKPKDIQIYEEACTHRSYKSQEAQGTDNERLEFLGDAVLELIVTDFLFKKFPDQNEGTLTSLRAAMVNKNNLAKMAKELNLGDFLLLGKGEELSGGRSKEQLIADMLESLIGAIYTDLGFDICKKFIGDHIIPSLDEIMEKELFRDPKSQLQEIIQEKLSVTPHYDCINEDGPDHNKTFTMGLYFGDRLIAVGTGESKRKGEEAAARVALDRHVWEDSEK